MPELGEVARVVHFANKYLVGHTIRKATAFDDANVYGKAGCTAAEVQAALSGQKLVAARQQGKMFWFEMATPPHVLMHLGMAGWFHIRGVKTGYREAGVERGEDETAEPAEWPPKYAKFVIETDDGTEAAFVDFRRFGRIRLVKCAGAKMRQTSPLKENGPDPVQDKDKLSVGFLTALCARKKAPVKAVLLDQANISGIGNWLGDEILYDARMHPSRTCNSLSRAEVKQLHTSIHYVCGLACEVLADSSKFPPHWLFKWRWGKGNSNAPKKLPNGDRIEHITVGSRTTAFVPSVQKMSGASTAKVKVEQQDAAKAVKAASPKKATPKKPTATPTIPKKATPKKRKQEEDEEEVALEEDDDEDIKGEEQEDTKATPAKSKGASKVKQDPRTAASPAKARSPKKQKTTAKTETNSDVGASEAASPRRRSGRLSRA